MYKINAQARNKWQFTIKSKLWGHILWNYCFLDLDGPASSSTGLFLSISLNSKSSKYSSSADMINSTLESEKIRNFFYQHSEPSRSKFFITASFRKQRRIKYRFAGSSRSLSSCITPGINCGGEIISTKMLHSDRVPKCFGHS